MGVAGRKWKSRPRDKALTMKRLRELIHYDPETGIFTRRTSRGKHFQSGDRLGSPKPHGYWKGQLDGHDYYLHRLAWLYMTGEWPPEEIDHANLDRGDNRWENLRAATPGQNRMNTPQKRGASGFKGVVWSAQKRAWQGRVKCENRWHHVGFFADPAIAAVAVNKKRAELHGEFARHV